MALILLF
ncbi:hypothetical protein YPPY10_3135, partial [Yersinia pestis PY-10]